MARDNNRHDRDTLWSMTIMWNLVTILDGPCAFIELTSSFEPLTLSPDPFVTRYFVCPRFDLRYPYTLFNLITDKHIYSFRDVTSSWPSHMLASFIDAISRSGPRVSIRHSDGQIPLSIHMPQHIPSEYLSWHLYDHPVTEWWWMQSRQPPEIVIRYDLTV